MSVLGVLSSGRVTQTVLIRRFLRKPGRRCVANDQLTRREGAGDAGCTRGSSLSDKTERFHVTYTPCHRSNTGVSSRFGLSLGRRLPCSASGGVLGPGDRTAGFTLLGEERDIRLFESWSLRRWPLVVLVRAGPTPGEAARKLRPEPTGALCRPRHRSLTRLVGFFLRPSRLRSPWFLSGLMAWRGCAERPDPQRLSRVIVGRGAPRKVRGAAHTASPAVSS